MFYYITTKYEKCFAKMKNCRKKRVGNNFKVVIKSTWDDKDNHNVRY